jgi:hypothetical protein
MELMSTRDRLARTETGEIDLARAHLARLVLASRDLVAAAGHDPDRGDCHDAGCALAEVDAGSRRCRLAHRLSLLDVVDAAVPPPGAGPRPLSRALHRFDRAVLESLDAVRACRQTGHPGGHCWSSPTPGHDGCGEVLRLAHHTG